MAEYIWTNEPDKWLDCDGTVRVVTKAATDFWNETWYDFTHFNGHFYGCDVEDDFTFQVRVKADFQTLYDQAGIMLMADESQWMKAGIEYNDGQPAMGSVLTQDTSDWATGIFQGNPRDFWMRLTRKDDSYRLQYSVDGKVWPLLRLFHFDPDECCRVGLMCCTPKRSGLEVTFSDITLTAPLDKALHDLT